MIDEGRVVETGTPAELLENKYSYFYYLAEQSNEIDEIFRLSNSAASLRQHHVGEGDSTGPLQLDDSYVEYLIHDLDQFGVSFIS